MRIAVVGAGVAGCAVARELVCDHEVVVVERDQVAGSATALAAGEVTMTPSYTDVPSVAEYANEFFRTYDGTGHFTFSECESLELVTDEHREAAWRRVGRLQEDGIDVAFLDAQRVSELYPSFDLDGTPYGGAVRFDDTGFVDPYTFASTLADDARADGAEFRTGVTVTGVADSDGAVTGVETTDGTVPADAVVAAAGWRTRDLLADAVPLPVRPYRTQCVVLSADVPISDGLPMGWVPGEHAYFRPERNGDFLVGGWSAAVEDPEAASSDADEAFRDHVAELVPRLLDGFDDARFVDGWAGVDGATPDTRPIIDAPDDSPDGLVIATGFHGRGIMTAPAAATAVNAHLTGVDAPFPLDEFTLDRFESRTTDFEFQSVSA
jgi:glycine/D-amino acid oxidase-like deaminating enzyme